MASKKPAVSRGGAAKTGKFVIVREPKRNKNPSRAATVRVVAKPRHTRSA